jgi:ComF family protein
MITKIQKLNWSVDIITPVPLGLARLKERGYNQAALLARPIALSLKLPYLPKLLKRTRETPSQVDLSYNERQENMADAFKAQNESARGKTILVVDDVATSGATINACAKALLDIGVSKVYGFSLTRAVLLPEGSDFDNC